VIAEFNAVKSKLSAVPILSGHVFTPDDEEQARGTYLLVFPAGPESMDDERDQTMVTTTSGSDAEYSFNVRAVAPDVAGVGLIAEAVKSLVGTKVTVSGRRCDPITVVFDPVKKDNSVSPALFFMDMWVEFWSRRG